MANIQITTNGTVEGTVLIVDGKELSKKEKITSISLYANAPYVSQYSGEVRKGHISVSYDKANEDGTIETQSLFSGPNTSVTGVGQKIKAKDQVIRYINQEVDTEITDLVGRIVDHAKTKDIKIPTKEDLLTRTVTSLKDKCEDLGIDIKTIKT